MADSVVVAAAQQMLISYSYPLMLLFTLLALLPLLALCYYLLSPTTAAAATTSGSKQESQQMSSRSRKKTTSSSLPLPPRPPGALPIIGHLHLIMNGGEQPHVALRDLAEKHGDLMLLRLGQVPNLVVSSARAAEAVMRTHDHVFASRPRSSLVDALLHGSMDVAFAPYGEQWRQSRKLVTAHLLTAKKVASFRHARHEEVRQAIAEIRRRDHVGVVDVSELLYSFTNDIVCRAVSGKFIMAEGGRNGIFRQLIGTNTAVLDGFNLENYFPSLARLPLLAWVLCRKARRHQGRWGDLLDKLIDAHASKSSLLAQPEQDEEQDQTDFIDVMLSLQQEYGLTRDDMKAILIDMFAAGIDTSFIAMEFALAELVRNPRTLVKLQAEVRTNTPKSQDMVMEEDLGNMTYLKAVIKETLRLHPPVPLLLPHYSMADCTIDGYLIPAQTRVIVNAWAISRDPRSWDRAEEFVPERFVDETVATSPKLLGGVDFKGSDFRFTPFGAGRRVCPGLNFGLATVEIMLANLIYCFDWELPAGMRREDIDMTDVFGLTMRRKEKLFLVPKPYTPI